MRSFKDAVLLDSSFIIATQLVSSIQYNKSVKLLGALFDRDVPLILIPTTLDEFWYVNKRILAEVIPVTLVFEVKTRLIRLTESILAFKNVTLVSPEITKQNALEILNIMYRFDLRPRDAMIIKSMEILGIKKLATFDTDFDRVKGINVIK